MSRTGDAMISCWEAGAVPAEIDEVRSWRAAGHAVPITFVSVTNWQGREVPMPAIGLEDAERLATSLEDETARETLRAACEDARAYLGLVRREGPGDYGLEVAERMAARSCVSTASRLAAEIIAAVSRGDDLPEEWHRFDAYADVGEPTACEVVRLVRDELQTTGVRA